MKEKDDHTTFAAGGMEGARRATGMPPAAAGHDVRRWSAQRKEDVVLQVLQGASLDELSRQLGVPHYRLEEWRTKALHGMREALKERGKGDPLAAELARAKQQIGELAMRNELLEERLKKGAQ